MNTLGYAWEGRDRLVLRPGAAAEYAYVLESITWPILEHIERLPDELFFFLEEERTGIYMPHGIADKNYHKPKRLKKCQALLYPGPLWRDKFVRQGVKREKIHIVGWPRLDPYFQGKFPRKQRSKPQILWAPTHAAIASLSSYPAFAAYLTQFPDKYDVVASVHPANRTNRRTSLGQLAQADVVLSGSSGVLYEAMAMGKPVILLDWLVKDGVLGRSDTFEARLYREGIGYHATSFSHLVSMLPEVLANGPDARAQKFMDSFFPPELRGCSGKAAAEVLKAWL